jgi:hypothetical protein
MRHVSLGTAALALCLVGCLDTDHYPVHYRVYIDPALDSRVSDVVEVLTEWEDKAGVRFDLTLADIDANQDTSEVIAFHLSTHAVIQRLAGNKGTIGLTIAGGFGHGPETYQGWANILLPLDATQETIAHEAGHGMGLIHTAPGTLMCWNESCAPKDGKVTCHDVNQYRTLRALPLVACQ